MTDDAAWMAGARALGLSRRRVAPPNPWVGCVVVDTDGGEAGAGATSAPGGPHAEVVALGRAGPRAAGATLYVTLEPCAHTGRTPPCVAAIIAAGVARVVVGLADPDPRVSGRGIAALRAAGVPVSCGTAAGAIAEDLAPYLWHRTTGRPYVVLKVAATLDGRVAMVDGTSQWITGEPARADAHQLRADSDAVIVGAGTVRADDPSLTARLGDVVVEPLRVVLGAAPPGAKVHPCLERSGPLEPILTELGGRGVLQVLVEGGPYTAGEFVAANLVNRVVWYLAPALAGAGRAAVDGPLAETIADLRRGRVVAVRQVGADVRVEVSWNEDVTKTA